MATADELLALEMCDNVLIVDLDSRTIIIPKTVTNIGVESDDNVEVMHFKLPRHHCNVDLSTFKIQINYLNAKGGGDLYEVKNAVISEDLITFDWVVGRNAVTYKGNVTFNVCLKELDEDGEVVREFNTTIATLPVLPGLETGEKVVQEYADVLEQWRSELFGAGDTVEQKINDIVSDASTTIEDSVNSYVANHADELRGPRGYTFTPSVDINGNLSWTNDGGLYNPTTRNITGPIGPIGLTGPAGEDGATIDTVVRTSGTGAAGTVDTYTITMTDGNTHTFAVYNGADGQGAGDMLKSVYDPQNKNTDVFSYVDNIVGNIDALLDSINGE